jgi:cytochrome c oxidase cbb3-type subunit 2
MAQSNHDFIERKVGWLIVFTLLTVSIGGLVEIVPLFFQHSTTTPVEGLKPYDPVRLVGRDIYIREGCYNCHSQMIRPFRAETERYGHYSVAGEYVYDHPSSGAPSVPVPTCIALAAVTPTSGIAST